MAEEKSLELLQEVCSNALEVIPQIKLLIEKCKAAKINTNKGVSFLDVKNHELLSYMINLTHVLMTKTMGDSIADCADIERLVEIRTVLEKMRPTEQKLKYQIDKLLHLASNTCDQEADPLRLKPKPENLISKMEEDKTDSEGEDTASSKTKLYKPAKVVPVFYDGDQSVREREDRQKEKERRRMASSSVMRDLYNQYTDRPEEIRDSVGGYKVKEDKLVKERTEYEENYFVRKSRTKKEWNAEKKRRLSSGLDDITRFPDFTLFGAERKKRKFTKKADNFIENKIRKSLPKIRKKH